MSNNTTTNEYEPNNSGNGVILGLYANREWKEVEVNGKDVEVPTQWEVRNLGAIFNFINGSAFKPSDWKKENKGARIVRIQNLTNPIAEYNYTERELDSLVTISSGDILMSWSGTLEVFRWAGPKAALNQHIFRVDLRSEICTSFSEIILRHSMTHLRSQAHGATMVHIRKGVVEETQFLLPPFLEQSLIAQALSTQEAQVADLRKLASHERKRLEWLSDELLSGRLRVVEDPDAEPVVVSRNENGEAVEVLPGVRLVENEGFDACVLNGDPAEVPQAWKVEKIKNLVSLRKGKTTSSKNYVGLENIVPGVGAYLESSGAKVVDGATSSVFHKGDVLYGKLRPYLRKCWIAGFDGACSTEFLVLTPQCNSTFILAHLLGKEVTNIACGASEGTRMPRTNWGTIGDIDILYPPVKEQCLIAAVLSSQEKQVAEIEHIAALEQKRLDWLSDELLSGRLRLRVKEAS